ncbi:MAG: carbohydrate kinase [Bacteroidota bacterium]
MHSKADIKNLDVICFGESLIDLFPTGPLPGGAPMNVAHHLRNFNLKTGLITRVGNDERGVSILDFLNNHGVNTNLVQIDNERETGIVQVNVDKNDDPAYTIIENVAWDYIDDSFLNQNLNPKYIVHGSLICRSAESSNSLHTLLQNTQATVVFDLNIRAPYYNKSVIEELLKRTHILKVNNDEFEMLKDWFYIGKADERGNLRALKSLFPNLEIIIVTKGAKGAVAWRNDEMLKVKSIPIKVKDAVGSGDAFLAGFISQIDQGVSLEEALTYAIKVGAYVATKKGANPKYSEDDITDFAL